MGWDVVEITRDPSWDRDAHPDHPKAGAELIMRGGEGNPLIVRVEGKAAVIPWGMLLEIMGGAVRSARIRALERASPQKLLGFE